MPRVWVNESAAREIRRGALHVYAQNVEGVEASDGDWVEVLHGGETLAYGFFTKGSSIPVKIYSWGEDDPWEVISSRMEDLFVQKKRLYDESFRWVFAEGDLLPGLLVDVFKDVAALRINVKGLERFKEDIADLIVDHGVENVVERNDGKSRLKEGLPLRKGLLRGRKHKTVIQEGAVKFFVDVLKGQKTGFYLDQRENRIFSERFAGGRILDVFSYTGGFGIHMGALGGEVHFVELGEAAAELLKRNIELNNVSGKIFKGDAVDVMRKLLRRGERYDVVSLDPPALIKNRADVEKGKRMYFLLNRLAMRLLKPGGVLLSSSCSHFLTPKDFLGIIRGAAEKESKRIRLMGSLRGQAPDHSVYLPQPETLYLKFAPLWVEP
ncbi:MAG: class I SAM-dependent rRNA methyltransferase [Candidatus Diapherotrites archaeon]|nr:class I SAM-dependent rRNA methyltransferase [Candidatus Diapherotrites archaeon]